VQAVGNLEAALARVSDITGATAAEQVALQEAVNNAVSTLGVAADQAAGALLLMAEDGFSASEAVGSLNTVLAFAKANAQDAATATQALGGVLDTFGEKPAIIAQLADQLTAASRAAGVGTVTLQNGLAAIGVQAEQAGLGVSEATAALAALASRGIEGTQAAKQLGTVLTELNNPASAAGKALDEAGLKGKSFAEIVDVLSKDAAKAAPILEALGNRPRAALKVLLADGGGALREFNTIVANAGNASADAAAKIDETFNGALARLQATIDNLRNKFLAPILQPLADEFAKVSEQLNGLADSPQFARIRTQFAEFATATIKSIGDIVANVDLEQLAGDIADFGGRAKQAFDALVVVVEATATAIRGIASAIAFVQEKAEEFERFTGLAADGAKRIGVASSDASLSLNRLGTTLDKNKKSTREFATGAEGAADSARVFATAVEDAGDAAEDAGDKLGKMPEPAKLSVKALDQTKESALQLAIAFERVQVGTFIRSMDLLRNAGLQTSDTYKALSAQFLAAEGRINALTAEQEKLANKTEQVEQKTRSATASLREYAGAARDAGNAAGEAGDAAESAGDSFGNIARQSSAVEIGLGNLTEAYVREALAAAGSAKSAREYIRTLNGFFAAAADVEKQLKDRIDSLSKLNVVLSEEDQIRARLIQQYGNSSRLVEELVQQELRLAEAKRKTNDEAERGIQIEERRVSAGALGTGRAADAAPLSVATGGRGSTQQGGGDRATSPQIVINVQGMTSDQARDFVSRSVVPELERINRLGR